MSTFFYDKNYMTIKSQVKSVKSSDAMNDDSMIMKEIDKFNVSNGDILYSLGRKYTTWQE